MKLSEIVWPVYKLTKSRPIEVDNKLVYITSSSSGEEVIQIVDDKNIPGATLASRRLVHLFNKGKLYPIKYTIYFLGDLLKMSKPNLWFIDSSGKLFRYTKTKMAKLVCRRITNIIKATGSSFIEVEGLSIRFPCLYPPKLEQKYAGILKTTEGYILYGFYTSIFSPTVRKV